MTRGVAMWGMVCVIGPFALSQPASLERGLVGKPNQQARCMHIIQVSKCLEA